MIKRGYSIRMTYEVSDSEKQRAEKALLHFNHAIKLLSLASDHLNIMKIPFKEHPEIDVKAIKKARAAIRRFRDQAINSFNDFKIESFRCINIMKSFSTDNQTSKIMKSFITAVDDLEVYVNDFVGLFNELESKEFPKKIVEDIEKIQEQCEEIEEIVDERIKDHIQSNILATSWVDSVSNELQMEVEEKTPLMLELFDKRQEELGRKTREDAK